MPALPSAGRSRKRARRFGRALCFSPLDADLAASMRVALAGLAHVGDVFAEGGGEVDLVVLFLDEDLADLFGHGEFAEGFALADAVAVVADGFVFVVEIEAEHLLGVFGGFYGLGNDGGHFA